MTQRTIWALSAAAVAGVAAMQMQRFMSRWRRTNLSFDFPIEEQLFIGWGGSRPKRRYGYR